MAVYSVEGKLGTGKTKFCVWMAQQALLARRRVASNVDLDCTVLTPFKRSTYVRLPDKPRALDLEAMGHGNPASYDEDHNGVLILDELGTWLNSRSFQDKDRMPVIDWLIHARKHGWDVYLIVQDAGMIDKQVREALIEYQCRCMSLAKIRIPFVGKTLSLFHERAGYLPRAHTVTARTGYGLNAIVAERWMFTGKDLHAAYDTRQIFTNDYPNGAHSVLPPWDWKPRPLPWIATAMPRAAAFVRGVFNPPPRQRPPARPKHPLAAQFMHLPAEQRVAAVRHALIGREEQERRIGALLAKLPIHERLPYLRRALDMGHTQWSFVNDAIGRLQAAELRKSEAQRNGFSVAKPVADWRNVRTA
jgi:hypothetical protein